MARPAIGKPVQIMIPRNEYRVSCYAGQITNIYAEDHYIDAVYFDPSSVRWELMTVISTKAQVSSEMDPWWRYPEGLS